MTPTLHEADQELKSAITHALEWVPAVNTNHVAVSVTQGAVTLSGEVLTYPEKTAAVTAALGVRGVTALVDDLTVRPGWGLRDDADIARDVAAALTASAVVPTGSVKAAVEDHWVTLTGELHWHYQRETAVNLVGGIDGVRGVHNEIALRPTLPFAATHARTAVKAALVRGALTDARAVEIAAHGTELELTGTVHSWHEFREASEAAWSTPGVTHVHNNLVVAP